MKLKDFIARYSDLDDQAFLSRFPHPFLLESTDFLEEYEERRVFLVHSDHPGGIVVIGRGRSCDVSINDPLVSTCHAEVSPPPAPGKPWEVTDRESTHKTRVKEEEIPTNEATPIPDGTRLSFGPASHYVFLHGGSFLRQFHELCPKSGTRTGRYPSLGDEVQSEPAPNRDAELYVYCEPLEPKLLEVGECIVIGRDEKVCDLVIRDKLASREHTEIERRAWGVFVRDLGSANGTYLGSTKLGEDWTFLAVGQVLSIGTTQIYVQRPQPEASAVHTRKMTRDMVRRLKKKRTPGIRGELRDTPLAEMLQQIEERKDTGILEVNGATLSGRLTFFQGHPCEASSSDGHDELNAILSLLKEKRGTYTLQLLGETRMRRSFSEILLEEFLSEI